MKAFILIVFASGAWLICDQKRANDQTQPFSVRAEIFATQAEEPRSEAQAVRVGDTVAVSFEGWWRIDSINNYITP